MTVIPERLTELEALTLKSGSHSAGAREYCFNEAAAWLAGEKHSDAPTCVSPVLRRYTMRLNDRWNDEQRQTLKPYLTRVIGTADDGKDEAREAIAAQFLCTDLLGPWLRLAGMDEQADALSALTAATPAEISEHLYKVRAEAWRRRDASYASLKAKVRERLADRPAAVAVAAAVADAAAVAVAAAVADAAADAAAVAVAVAAAVAAAVADAAADAAADAVAVAAAAAAADAVAVAVAEPWRRYDAAYAAARQYFRDNPLPISEKVHALGNEQAPLAITLLDRMINPTKENA